MEKHTIDIDLGFTAKKFQRECFVDMKRFNCYVVHRRAGKSYGSLMRLLASAARTKRKDAQYAFIGPWAEQTYNIAWKAISGKAQLIPGVKLDDGKGKSPSRIWLPNNAEIQILGGSNPDSKRGTYLDGVVIDEVADIKPKLWFEVVYPMLTDAGRNGWAILQGTPKGINLLSQLYYDAVANPLWSAKKFTIYDTQNWGPDEIKQIRDNMPADRFAQEYMCDFSAGNNRCLIKESEVNEAVARVHPPGAYRSARRLLGVDVARHGDDSSVIQKRQGICAQWAPYAMRGCDTNQVAAKIREIDAEWKADQIFIDGTGGYGAGVIDRLRLLGMNNIVDVQFAGSPQDPRFQNKRAEMWWRGAEWVKKYGSLFNDQRLKLDLCTPEYDYENARGKFQLESKESIKDRAMPSPDYGDAFMVTFAETVPEEDTEQENNTRLLQGGAWLAGPERSRNGDAENRWDPYADIDRGFE